MEPIQKKLSVELISKPPMDLAAKAAKICYAKDIGTINMTKGEADEFMNMLVEIGHESPLEHMNFTFLIRGVSRSLTHQLVRHRIASYSQRSQRYVNEMAFGYVVPQNIAISTRANDILTLHLKSVLDAYGELIVTLFATALHRHVKFINSVAQDRLLAEITEVLSHPDYKKVIRPAEYSFERLAVLKDLAAKCGISKDDLSKIEKSAIEDARCVLPNATASDIIVTMNARSLKNFFAERMCAMAQHEIRTMANQMHTALIYEGYDLFKLMGAKCKNLGYCTEGKRSCGLYPLKEDVLMR